MRITLKQLRVFAAVARFENMTQAAEDIALTQSAMSMALKELESQLNAPLFHRYGKRIKLNHKGESLLPKVLQILQLAQEIEYQAGLDSVAGLLRVGASSTIGNYLVPAIIADFLKQQDAIDIDLKVGNTQQVIQDVLHHRLDIGLIEGLCDEPQIERIPWKEDELVVFASANHPLAKKSLLTVDDLKKVQWILREAGSGTREIFSHALGGKFQPEQRILELGNTEAIKQAVKTGFGISCLSKLAIASEVKYKELVVLPVEGINLKRQFFIIKHQVHTDNSLIEIFEEAL
ncbi:MAG: LysR family transcriptional regulator [Cellvibrionales bacterium]|nr:LysR family transcriptional regulator [Cellvibrionales bacterium]